MFFSSFPCNDGHLSHSLIYYFYADLYCYANVTYTYAISVLLTGTCRSQQSVEVLISIKWFVNAIVLLPLHFTAFRNFSRSCDVKLPNVTTNKLQLRDGKVQMWRYTLTA